MAEQVNAQNELNIKDIWERLIILGYYDTAEELTAAHATGTVGDCYKVGDDLYTWDGAGWVDIGRIKGDKGDTSYDAATAGKLKSPVNLSVTDGAGGHKGAATSFDGSGDVELVLPAIIKATLEGNATTATTATKLGTATVGSTTRPIYLNQGTATALSATVGSGTQPVWLNAGTLTACTGAGVITASSDLSSDVIHYFVKFSNGLILQWGYAETYSVIFPTPFTKATYAVMITDSSGEKDYTYQSYRWPKNTIRSTTLMNVVSATTGTNGGDGFFWFAIGV